MVYVQIKLVMSLICLVEIHHTFYLEQPAILLIFYEGRYQQAKKNFQNMLNEYQQSKSFITIFKLQIEHYDFFLNPDYKMPGHLGK